MNILLFLYIVLLFVALTPSVLITLPPKSSKLVVALTHGAIFGGIWWLTHKWAWMFSEKLMG